MAVEPVVQVHLHGHDGVQWPALQPPWQPSSHGDWPVQRHGHSELYRRCDGQYLKAACVQVLRRLPGDAHAQHLAVHQSDQPRVVPVLELPDAQSGAATDLAALQSAAVLQEL